MWSGIFFVSCVILCGLCALAAYSSARSAYHESDSLRRRLRSVELQSESNADSLKETQAALEVVTNRVKMQRVRTAAEHVKGSSDEPDPWKDPDAWRKMMNSRIQRQKMGL